MNNITDRDFQEAVLIEAKNLRKHATKSEISNLEAELVDAVVAHTCIYGQMTGHCDSPRAVELMHLCCERICTIDLQLNGVITADHRRDSIKRSFFSPIEVYIMGERDLFFVSRTAHKRVDSLVTYLQGESDELSFEED